MASKKRQEKDSSPGVKCWEDRKEIDCMFTGRALVACSLPLNPVRVWIQTKKDGPSVQKFASLYERRNGPFQVTIVANEKYGIPYGKDRLFLYWIITRVVRTKQRVVYYDSIRLLLDSLGVPYGKSGRDWLRGAIDRVLNSTLFFDYQNGLVHGTDSDTILSKVVGILDPKLGKSRAYDECYFEISHDLYLELVENNHAIPFDMEVIRQLGEGYAAMDVYVWWNRKIWTSRNEPSPYIYVPIDALQEQFSGAEKVPRFRFKQQLKQRILEVNRAIKYVYGIDPELSLIKDKLCFKKIDPLLEHLQTPSKPLEKPKLETLPEEINQVTTSPKPTLEQSLSPFNFLEQVNRIRAARADIGDSDLTK